MSCRGCLGHLRSFRSLGVEVVVRNVGMLCTDWGDRLEVGEIV